MEKCEFKTKKPNPQFDGVFDIEPQELVKNLDKVQLIDVRQPDEYVGELGHVPGAKLLVLDELPQTINQVQKDKTVVFICRSGGRSARASAFALSQGYQSVFNMRGGMLLWNELQLQTAKN